MKSVTEEAFRPYGRVLPLETKEFCEVLKAIEIPAEGTVYEPSVAAFEALPLFKELTEKTYGEMPTEARPLQRPQRGPQCARVSPLVGNRHRGDGSRADGRPPAGHRPGDADVRHEQGRVLLRASWHGRRAYATTLHFAPCGIDGQEFRCGVALPRGTNEALKNPIAKEGRTAYCSRSTSG